MTESIESLVERTKAGERAAAERLVMHIQDDVFRLAFRMLGLRAEAEDATQEILLQVLTHLSEFRGESAFRTWVWRIASRHVLRQKKSRREELASFETIEMLKERGDSNPPLPSLPEAEIALLAEEVRLSCTQAMILSLERDQRVSWILAEVFDLSSEEAAEVLAIEPAAHRKRLSRAREKLGAWMGKHCGLAQPESSCRCKRQIPVAMEFGVVDVKELHYAERGVTPRMLPLIQQRDEIEAAAEAMKVHPAYRPSPVVFEQIRALLTSGRYLVFDA